MFKSKSFDLVNEEELKKSKTSDKYGWMRYCICPAIIGFMLLLILVNVDFSGGSRKEELITGTEGLHSTFITQAYTDREVVLDEFGKTTEKIGEKKIKFREAISTSEGSTEFLIEPTQVQEENKRLGDICTEKANACILNCQISLNEKDLNTRLETQQGKCDPYDLQLTLTASMYTKSTLGKNFLSGKFRIETLFLNQGILYEIDNNAFNKQSLNNLKQLTIEGFTVSKLNQQTFTGLNSITSFKMVNKENLNKFDGKHFLKPMAGTLTEMIFSQSSTLKSYDPTAWFDGNDLVALTHVDLNGNKFPDTLNRNTFLRFVRVESLILRNCGIEYFEENTFSTIFATLKYLDLSRNYLKTLSPDFLVSLSSNDIKVSLLSNEFACDCDNREFVESIQQNEIIFDQEPQCSRPPEWYGKKIKEVKNFCDGSPPPTTPTTDETQITEDSSTTETITTDTDETTTTYATESTATTDTTQTSYTTDPTNIPESEEEIQFSYFECKSTIDFSVSLVPIRDKSIYFVLRTISTNTILIEFQEPYEDIQLIFFYSSNRENAVTIQITESKVPIDNLLANEGYLFCALPSKQTDFSPYNCQSYHSGLDASQKRTAWLNVNDMPLFVSLSIMGAVVFLLIGMGIIFLLLRWRPTLLKGSKRLLKLSNDSKQVFLCKHQNQLSIEELYEALRTYAPLHSTAVDNFSNNDYLQFYMDRDVSSTIYAGINFGENFPPDQRAPALPPVHRERQYSGQSTIPADDNNFLPSIDEVKEEHEYQSLDQYEQIYETH